MKKNKEKRYRNQRCRKGGGKNLGMDLDKRIPKRTRVGGMDFEVCYPYTFKERTDIMGRVMQDREKIYVGNVSTTGQLCTKNHDFKVYLHEVFHVIDRVYCSNGIGEERDEETMIDGLACGMAQFLTDNFDMTPKKR